MTARPLDREDISWHNITVLAMELSKETKFVDNIEGDITATVVRFLSNCADATPAFLHKSFDDVLLVNCDVK